MINQELLLELTKREIKQRYKQSILGYAWVLLNPLAQMLVLSFVFSRLVTNQHLPAPYPIFLYIGLLPWTLFSTSLTTSAQSLIVNGKLLTKIYMPRTAFVQSTLLAKLVDFAFASSLLLLLFIFFHLPFYLTSLWIIPIIIIQQIFTYGLALLVASLNLFYRDIQYLLNLVIMLWMYLTPIIYPPEIFPRQLHWLFQLNPLAVFVTAYRQVLLEQTNPAWQPLILSLLISLAVYYLGKSVFHKLEGRFADVI